MNIAIEMIAYVKGITEGNDQKTHLERLQKTNRELWSFTVSTSKLGTLIWPFSILWLNIEEVKMHPLYLNTESYILLSISAALSLKKFKTSL